MALIVEIDVAAENLPTNFTVGEGDMIVFTSTGHTPYGLPLEVKVQVPSGDQHIQILGRYSDGALREQPSGSGAYRAAPPTPANSFVLAKAVARGVVDLDVSATSNGKGETTRFTVTVGDAQPE